MNNEWNGNDFDNNVNVNDNDRKGRLKYNNDGDSGIVTDKEAQVIHQVKRLEMIKV